MFKKSKIYILIITSLFLQFFTSQAVSANNNVDIYFFYGDGCPHCAREEEFLEELEQEIPEIEIHAYEVWKNTENAKLLGEIGESLNIDVAGVPMLFVGDKHFVGFHSTETTGAEIKKVIEDALNNGCSDVVASLNNEDIINRSCSDDQEEIEKINLPILGEIDIKDFSLPFLTIMIAALDGFNPCAMWVLLFLISLLLGMENRKRMWILGFVFIFSSSLVYFLFLSAWLNLFLFIGFLLWVRMAIAFVALGSGSYHVYDYFKNRKGTCHVTGSEKRQVVFQKIKNIIKMDNFFLALVGIALLAGAVNLVELLCSAGLPAIYTQVLAMSSLPKWQYYLYLILYIFIFMLDDLLIFIIAMSTLKMKAISSKYTRWSTLLGGIAMIIIGILLIFKPGWLMFG